MKQRHTMGTQSKRPKENDEMDDKICKAVCGMSGFNDNKRDDDGVNVLFVECSVWTQESVVLRLRTHLHWYKGALNTHAPHKSLDLCVGCDNALTNPELYFRDGKRKTDYVLAYRFSTSKYNDQNRRLLFLNELAKQKIEIEVEDSNGNLLGATVASNEDEFSSLTLKPSFAHLQASAPLHPGEYSESLMHTSPIDYVEPDKPTDTRPPSCMDRYRHQALDDKTILMTPDNLVFVKLHASWEAMTYYAEYLKMRKPLRQLENRPPKPSVLKDYFKCLQSDKNIIKPIDSCCTWPFSLNRQYLFDIPENKDEFFTAVERALVLDHILRRTGYKSEDLVNTEDLYEPSISKIFEY
ncbi:unnamed protein product, partial [Schistosoma margrebowiei]